MTPDDLQRLVDAGIYDPAADGAPERLALLEFLEGLGATVDEMLIVGAVPGGLPGLASIAARPKASVTLRELAERFGATVEVTAAQWEALGLPVFGPDVPLVSEEEATQLLPMARTVALLGEEQALQSLRATGHAIARLADAMVQPYVIGVEGAIEGELKRAHLAAAITETLGTTTLGFEAILVRHMAQSALRLRAGLSGTGGQTTLTIGFVDLVGFTSMSQSAGPDDLARLLADFEGRASAAVSSHDGWIVKLIGDAVMFAALDPSQGAAIAAELLRSISRDRPELEARGGLATGAVLARAGDYFGPVVNLAARAQGAAIEGEILLDEATAAAVVEPPAGMAIEPAGRRRLRGIADPVRLWSLHEDPAGAA